jgi:small-conductance mechanosensitive channel
MRREARIFIIVLLGAGLLYLPALLVIAPLPEQLLPVDKEGVRPENGMFPFAMLWFGIFAGGSIMWQINRLKVQSLFQTVWQGVSVGTIGAIALMLALPVLARGWEGFLLWFNPGLWLIGLILVIWGAFTGLLLALFGVLVWRKVEP